MTTRVGIRRSLPRIEAGLGKRAIIDEALWRSAKTPAPESGARTLRLVHDYRAYAPSQLRTIHAAARPRATAIAPTPVEISATRRTRVPTAATRVPAA